MSIRDCDRIEIDKDDLLRLLAWRDEHKELVRNFKPALTEGVIAFGDNIDIFFKYVEGIVAFSVVFGGDDFLMFTLNTMSMTVANTRIKGGMVTSKYGKEEIKELTGDCITTYCSMMAYMTANSDDAELVVVEKQVTKKPPKKRKKGGGKKSNIVKITRDIIRIYVRESSSEKRKYERHTESWGVRGFWRTSKLGKRTWVNAYEKGKGAKTPKTYRM